MEEKIIIGFIGDSRSGKTTAADVLHELGFYKTSINKKVYEFAVQLLGEDSPDEETIQIVRQKGYGVNRGYWLNLALMSVPDNQDYIVIDDICEIDMIRNVIMPYQIIRGDKFDIDNTIEGATIILNSGNVEEFEEHIKTFFSSIIKK